MDRLLAMQAFVRVVEVGNFVRAANSMNLPKPTVTRLIQMLESHLQTKLFNRTTRRVTVTVEGAAYYERALHLLSELDELEAGMVHAKSKPRGRLRIDAAPAVAQQVLIPALPDFHTRYPDIQVNLGVSDRPVDLISENIDCVLRGGELTDQSLVARRIGEFHLVYCAAPAYLERHGKPTHPRDIEADGHKVINFFSPRTGKVFPFTFTNATERIEFEGRHVVAMNDSNATLAAALAGLGIMRSTTVMVQPHIASGQLVPLLLDWCADSIPIHVVYPPNRHLSTKLRVFIDWIAELFSCSDFVQRQCSLQGLAAAAAAAAQPASPRALDGLPLHA
ncbi:LysR substrate-binding domain-containing protein [Roseateles sp. 22389]|uniref:LysR family transcriptional regulator n=1 Tax=Roseateles sp. 22389 TaxID=3453916 RepID=UPI002631DD60|nr:LysR family transcriptional regulator [uncultured Roseateles sp.]